MRTLSIRTMRSELPRLDRLVEEAGEVLVTRHGRAIARLLPVRPVVKRPDHRALRASLPRSGRDSAEWIRADRDAR